MPVAERHIELWPEHGGFPDWPDCQGYIRGLVVKLGVPPQEADDVTGNIVVHLVRRDVFAMYVPGTISPHNGKPVTFRAFLSHQVSLYVRGQRDKLSRLAEREHLICDRPSDSGASWAELFGGAWFDDYSSLDARTFIDRTRTYLALVPPRSGTDRCNLLALFDELVRQAAEQGEVSLPVIQEMFGIAPTTARSWVSRLRQVIASAPPQAPQPHFWVVGGIRLGVPEVVSAVTLLEGAKGIMVRQPLARAGHPLKDAEKNWYHPFSKAEIKAYPEVAVDPQTHKKPAGHVKLAVLHRFRRMLAEAGVTQGAPVTPERMPVAPASADSPGAQSVAPSQILTAPGHMPVPPSLHRSRGRGSLLYAGGEEPVPEPLELIEASLWQLGASPERVAYVMGLVGQVAA